MTTFEIIFDNGGGATLQTLDESYVHHYTSMSQLARDAAELIRTKCDTYNFDGYEPEHHISDDKFNDNPHTYFLITQNDIEQSKKIDSSFGINVKEFLGHLRTQQYFKNIIK